MSIRANGTAVYLGNGWVLTANHTTGGDMTFNGQTFSEVPGTEQWISTGSGDVLTTWATFDFADGTSEAQAVAGDSGGPVFANHGA